MMRWEFHLGTNFALAFNQQEAEYKRQSLLGHSVLRAPYEKELAAFLRIENKLNRMATFRLDPANMPAAFDPPHRDFPNFRVIDEDPWFAYFCLNPFGTPRVTFLVLRYGKISSREGLEALLSQSRENCL